VSRWTQCSATGHSYRARKLPAGVGRGENQASNLACRSRLILPYKGFSVLLVDVVEEVVGFSVVGRSLETLKKYFEQRPNHPPITHQEHLRTLEGSFISSFGSF
jgi:hypothetical protein